MGFKLNKNFEKDFEKDVKKMVKKELENRTGGKVTKMIKTADGFNSQISFDTFEKMDKYIETNGVDGIDWEASKKMKDMPKEFAKKYEEYLK